MAPAVRQFVLTVHLTSSLGWLGAVVAYIALGVTAATSPGCPDGSCCLDRHGVDWLVRHRFRLLWLRC